MPLHPTVAAVTDRIRARSADTRRVYLDRTAAMAARRRAVDRTGCSNLAHAWAALPASDRAQAQRWLEQAASAGNRPAQARLGSFR